MPVSAGVGSACRGEQLSVVSSQKLSVAVGMRCPLQVGLLDKHSNPLGRALMMSNTTDQAL